MTDIHKKFRLTLVEGKLKDLSEELIELGFDALIDNEFLKSLPLLKTILTFKETSSKIHKNFITKKILKFLFEFHKTTNEERNATLNKIEIDERYSKDFSERLLLIIDSYDDYDKATLLGKAFKKLIDGSIHTQQFMRIAHILNKAFIPDLYATINFNDKDASNFIKQSLYNLGLLSICPKGIENGMSGLEVRLRLNKTEYELNETGYLIVDLIT